MHVSELTKQYDGKTVVDGVTFAIPKGKVLSLIGPNGAGKSTVMGMISRLIARDSGLVDFEGRDIAKWKSKELSKRLAILTQSNSIQMKLTVRELVTFGRFPYSGSRVYPGGPAHHRPGHFLHGTGGLPGPLHGRALRRPAPAGHDRHGHRPGHGVCPAGRAHQQPGYLPCHQHDENRPPPLRRAGQRR